MNLLCKLRGHKWDGCKCTRCNETRDAMHEFEPLKNQCIKRCTKCGKEVKILHTWEKDGCMYRCKVCGTTKTNHQWKSHRCAECGIYDDELQRLFTDQYVNVNDISVSNFLDSLDQEILTELALKANCGYVQHAAWERVTEPKLLLKIKNETGNDYIRRLITKKFRCPNCGNELGVNEMEQCRCSSCGEDVHDYADVVESEHDGRLFESGIQYQRCRRCGYTTKPKEYMHYLD